MRLRTPMALAQVMGPGLVMLRKVPQQQARCEKPAHFMIGSSDGVEDGPRASMSLGNRVGSCIAGEELPPEDSMDSTDLDAEPIACLRIRPDAQKEL